MSFIRLLNWIGEKQRPLISLKNFGSSFEQQNKRESTMSESEDIQLAVGKRTNEISCIDGLILI